MLTLQKKAKNARRQTTLAVNYRQAHQRAARKTPLFIILSISTIRCVSITTHNGRSVCIKKGAVFQIRVCRVVGVTTSHRQRGVCLPISILYTKHRIFSRQHESDILVCSLKNRIFRKRRPFVLFWHSYCLFTT